MRPVVVFSAVVFAAVAAAMASGHVPAPPVPAKLSYRAASVVHTPIHIETGYMPKQMIADNLAVYQSFVHNASGADIIVFPESGTGYLQVPSNYISYFCESGPEIGWSTSDSECATVKYNETAQPHSIFGSCHARQYNMYLLINFCESTSDANKSYNLNVVFDRSGKVVSRYRKSHITGTGPYLSQPASPDPAVFTTDFGVTFGQFTCYDFWFSDPEVYDIVQGGAQAFLFPSEMMSAGPYYFVAGTIAGWSMANRVDVISAASRANAGAGVFQKGTTKCLNQPVPGGISEAHLLCIGELNVPLDASANVLSVNAARDVRKDIRPMNAPVKEVTVAAAGSDPKCFYGPSDYPVLHFPIGCAVFTPDAGVKYTLSANHSINNGKFGIQCEATVVAATGASTTWALVAFVLDMPPTVDTPTSTWTAACLVSHCLNTSECMSSDMQSDYETDLRVSAISVSARIIGIPPVQQWPYPFITTTNNLPTSYQINTLPLDGLTQYQRANANNDYTFAIGATTTTSPMLAHEAYFSGGFWFSNFLKSLNSTPSLGGKL